MSRGHLRRALVLAALVWLATMQSSRAGIGSPPPPSCNAGNCLDPLFTTEFPHTTTATTRSGVTFPLPLHYYDAALFGAIGTADLDTERELTAHTDFEPVVTNDGHGIGALLVADYADDDLGPYHESMIAFPVRRGGSMVVSDDPGAMVAALFDPSNEVWAIRLVLDQQLPIDAGREYLGIPKVPKPESMGVAVTPSHVMFDFSEADGTPIASGNIVLDPGRTPSSATDLAEQSTTTSVLPGTASRGYLHLVFVYRDVRRPSTVASTEVAARVGINAHVAIAPFDSGSHITANDKAPFGSDLAALGLHPVVSLVVENLHAVLDAHL